jgi:hypothetical protein
VFTSIPASAQMTKFKTLFLFNFAKNISWPDNSTEKYFLVTIIGDNELASELKELAKVRKVEAQQLIVKEASTVEAQTLTIFVPRAPESALLLQGGN